MQIASGSFPIHSIWAALITGAEPVGCYSHPIIMETLSTALISPFARARLPQSHRLRLSANRVDHVTTLNHRFENDYSQVERICQASLHKKTIPNIRIFCPAKMIERSEQLQNHDNTTFSYEFYMRQNIIDLCYIWMKSPKSLDRFRRCCYNLHVAAAKLWRRVGSPKGFQVREADCHYKSKI